MRTGEEEIKSSKEENTQEGQVILLAYFLIELKLMKNSAAAAKEERKDDFVTGDQGAGEITEKLVGAKPAYSGDTSKTYSFSNQTNPTINIKEIQLESTKAAMSEVREENERLKIILAQIVRDYQSLQMHFFDIMKQDQANIKPAQGVPSSSENKGQQVHYEEHELVSLCLGSRVLKMQEEKTNFSGKQTNDLNDCQIKQGLTLSLESKMEEHESDVKNEVQLSTSPENSSEGTAIKEGIATGDQTWPPSKAVKSPKHGQDEVAPQSQVKRARVSVRARCDAPTMNDGCQWRKYGQKIAKGNPCPRAYYRCTVAPGCPVRKQVQRCAEDMSILISTYEGNHNHPLPISATAMASTTAAAASMLISGSSTSPPAISPLHSTTGLNFSLPDSSHHNSQFFFTNPSISSTLSQPTITLDLTNPSATTVYQPNRFSSSSRNFYSPASFNFLPSDTSSTWNSSAGYVSYGTHQPYYKSCNMGGLRQSQESLVHSYAHKLPNPITDTIAKAITSDPSFQSALAAAITSYVGGGSVAGAIGEGSSGTGVAGALKWGEQLPLASSMAVASTSMGNSGYLAGSVSSNLTRQQGNLIFYPPSSEPSSSKNRPNGSPRDNS